MAIGRFGLHNAEFLKASWILAETTEVNVPSGIITFRVYIQELPNNTKLPKAVTTHSSRFSGYVCVQFEGINGIVQEGSDSGRVYSYYGAMAETPIAPDTIGWMGIIHAYCDED